MKVQLNSLIHQMHHQKAEFSSEKNFTQYLISFYKRSIMNKLLLKGPVFERE